MNGRARAPAAGTVLNALSTGIGSAFAIDLETTATVELTEDGEVIGEIDGEPDADTSLIERCVERTIESCKSMAGISISQVGARVRTETDIPIASGLKSSSAAANATVLATLDALEVVDAVDRIDACRIGVEAARDAGVTVTGAFDDASASMLGGVTVTDNEHDRLLSHERSDWDALVYVPPEQSLSADADLDRCSTIVPIVSVAEELARNRRYGDAMTVNGFAYCVALGRSTDPLLDALPDVLGVSLSGTGPSYVAIGQRGDLDAVKRHWDDRPGETYMLETRNDGANTIS